MISFNYEKINQFWQFQSNFTHTLYIKKLCFCFLLHLSYSLTFTEN